MKRYWRLGGLAAIIAGLIVLATPGSGLREPSAVEAAAGNNLTITVSDPGGTLDHQFLIVSPCGPDSSSLSNGEGDAYTCATPGAWTIDVNPGGTRDLTDISCAVSADQELVTPGPQSDFSNTDTLNAGDVYTIQILDDEDASCVFVFAASETDEDGLGGVSEGVDPLDQDGDGIIVFVAIAVVADPNVIPCGGTANLTATARAIDTGWVVPSELLAFHWSTDVGLLNVGPPNTADATDNHATLTLFPGMTSATVRVWIADLGEPNEAFPGEVVVQQFCPGVTVDNDQSMAPGAITLSSSSNTATCGEVLFLGARVRDSKNQVVLNDTVVSFIASAGEFQTGAGVTTDYSAGGEDASSASALNTVSQYNAATVSGVLNVTYIAPMINGDVVITAAAGDKFTKMTIKVTCNIAPAATAGTAGTQQACTPIGDGICITPPNTGSRIKPPSTGDAGLN